MTHAEGVPGIKILIADDEPGFQVLFKTILESKGFLVSVAKDGIEALELFKKNNFSLIFLDVHMPNKNGIEVLIEIKALNPAQPVVMLSSGMDYEGIRATSESSGAAACFSKPFGLDEIYKAVDKFLVNN